VRTLSRYSFIGCRPRKILRLRAKDHGNQNAGGTAKTIPTPRDPLTLIEEEMRGYRPVALPGPAALHRGAVGFIAYEYVTRIEATVPAARKDELGCPSSTSCFRDSLLIFDRAKQTLRLCVNAHVTGRSRCASPRPSRS
jgi:anthranilate synthase component 1